MERVGFVVPGRGQQDHRVVLETPGDKAEHADRRRIQPLQVLGHHQQRLLGGRVGEQVQGRHGQRERLRRRASGDAEGDPQSRPVWARGSAGPDGSSGWSSWYSPAIAMPVSGELPTVRKIRLDGAGPPHGLIDERRLADAGRPENQDGGAGLPIGEAGGEQAQLSLPADEHAAATTACVSVISIEYPTLPAQQIHREYVRAVPNPALWPQ